MKVGLDDFFAGGGTVEGLLKLASNALRPPPKSEETTEPERIYFTDNGHTYWNKETKDGQVPILLANFKAEIVEQIVEDDGAEQRRLYRLRVLLQVRSYDISVLAEQFTWMNWPVEQLGPKAIVTAGMGSKDRLREAIQVLSSESIPTRIVYRHLGWILREGKAIYLHAGGAIGAEGVVVGIDVRVDAPLDRYLLPAPPDGPDLVTAIRESLALLDGLASDRVVFPMFSFLWTVITVPPEESLHITGKTGARKTELLALIQRHHGASMDAAHLPLSWSSTGNMIEAVGFAAKDSVLGVDDFAPGGSAMDVQRQNRDADRVFRGRANGQGRGRLRPDGTPRPPKPPRAGIISTGEDVPHGHSVRARLIVLAVQEGEVDLSKLTERQAAGRQYSKTTAGFVRWIAPHLESTRKWAVSEVPRIRESLLSRVPHGRTATGGAQLIVGLRLFLQFAKDSGAIDQAQLGELDRRGREAILAVLADQAEHQAASDPAKVFVQLIGSALMAGEIHLADRTSGSVPEPDELARACGWQHTDEWRPRGSQVGWAEQDSDSVFLNPSAAYKAAQRQGENSPNRIGIGDRALWDRLHDAGFLVSEDPDRHTKKIRIGGRAQNVLHLRLSHLLGEPGTTGTDPEGGPDGDAIGDLFPFSVPDPAPIPMGTGTDNGNTPPPAEQPSPGDARVPEVPGPQEIEEPQPHEPPPPTKPEELCRNCRGIKYWRVKPTGTWLCGRCKPPLVAPDLIEWLEVSDLGERS